MLSCFSCVQLFAIPWTIARKAPLSMGFSRQEYWSGLPFPPPGKLPKSGIQTSTLVSPTLQADSLLLSHWGSLLLLLLLSHFSCVRLCATPETAAYQASPSLGFSRQEHWSGLPFPSPVHDSEKWKWSRSLVSDSNDPMDCSPPGSSVHGIFQARILEWVAFSSSRGASWVRDPTFNSCVSNIAGRFFTTEPLRNPT